MSVFVPAVKVLITINELHTEEALYAVMTYSQNRLIKYEPVFIFD
jgi:hypothetical protein